MARVFGITSTASGVSAVVLQGVTRNETADIKEATNEKGQVTDRIAVSVTKSAEIKGLVDGTISASAGAKVTAGGITDGLISNLSVTESNQDYQQFSCTVETKDAAVNVAYTAPTVGA